MTRRWHLVGTDRDGVVIVDRTCVGDEELSTALARLEQRRDYARHHVELERLGNRQPYVVPEAEPSTVAELDAAGVKGPPCSICELPKRECLRRAAVNGHDFLSRENA